jgi:membrane protein DedA with SNARE-associated domain
MRPTVFAGYAALAALAWGSYAGIVGYVGGRAFEDSVFLGLALGLVLATGTAAVVALAGRVRRPACDTC